MNIPVSIWATLSDELGYWINEKNAWQFNRYIKELVRKLDERNLKLRGLWHRSGITLQDIKKITDPKNKWDIIFTYVKMITVNLNKKRFNDSKHIFMMQQNSLRSKGLESYATCVRHCYYDMR